MIKNIAFLVPKFPIGGVERIIIDVSNYLMGHDYDVTVICGEFVAESYPQNKERKFKVEEIGEFRLNPTEPHPDQLVYLLKHLNIDVLFCHNKLSILDEIRNVAGCKVVFTHHGVPFWEYKERIVRKKEKKGWNHKLYYYTSVKLRNNRFIHRYLSKVLKDYRKTYDMYDAFTCLCEEYKRQLIKELRLMDYERRLFVLHNPEVRMQMTSQDKLFNRREKIVLYVGRLNYEDKRVDRLLRVWKKVQIGNDWKLLICGDGLERKKLEALAKELMLERVEFLGWVSNANEIMQRASILCLTSTFEGWPLCLTEAQANMLPAIAFNCSAGVEEILGPSDVNGVLVSPYNESEYAKKLKDLMDNDQMRLDIAKNAYEHVKRYRIEESGKEWVDMFQKLESSK